MKRLTSESVVVPAIVAVAIFAVHERSSAALDAAAVDSRPLVSDIEPLPAWHPPVPFSGPGLPPGHPPVSNRHPWLPEGHPRCPSQDGPTMHLPPKRESGWHVPDAVESIDL